MCGIRYGADERLDDENDDKKVMVAVGMLGVGVAPGALGQAEGGGVSPARRDDTLPPWLALLGRIRLSQLCAAPEGPVSPSSHK